jgi:hypothetical protein
LIASRLSVLWFFIEPHKLRSSFGVRRFIAVFTEGILEVPAYRGWLEDYRQGCSQSEVINAHIDIFSGFSAEEKEALIAKRQKAALTWYLAYKEGSVSKDDIRQLSAEFAKCKSKDPSAGQSLGNEFMINAFAAYLLHQKDFPEEREQAYWDAVMKALETFIEKAQ